jgi:hypothetical protein
VPPCTSSLRAWFGEYPDESSGDRSLGGTPRLAVPIIEEAGGSRTPAASWHSIRRCSLTSGDAFILKVASCVQAGPSAPPDPQELSSQPSGASSAAAARCRCYAPSAAGRSSQRDLGTLCRQCPLVIHTFTRSAALSRPSKPGQSGPVDPRARQGDNRASPRRMKSLHLESGRTYSFRPSQLPFIPTGHSGHSYTRVQGNRCFQLWLRNRRG